MMEQYLRQLIAIEFQDKKEIFTGFLLIILMTGFCFETILLIIFWMVLSF
jgi:hypothetical protein